jgi:DNA-binding MarR family transcriptional regulator
MVVKNRRYVFRLTDSEREYIRKVSLELHVPLPELLIMGAVMVRREVSTPAEFLRLKARLLGHLAEIEEPGILEG